MCIYAHVFSKGFFVFVQNNSLTLISGYLKNSIPVISGQRLWNRWRIRENEWERWAFKWTVSVYPCELYHHTEEWADTCTDSFIPTTPEISFCFTHRSMWIYFIGHVYTWKTQVCVNGWFMQRGYRNGFF